MNTSLGVCNSKGDTRERQMLVTNKYDKAKEEKRATFEEIWTEVAKVVARRATCLRLKVGAVLVDEDNQIISTGYNGAAAGRPHCLTAGCQMEKGNCIRTVHAEINALLQADKSRVRGGTMYVTHFPCTRCLAILSNTKLARVIYIEEYDGKDVKEDAKADVKV